MGQLWRDLTPPERASWRRRFASIDPNAIRSLALSEHALLLQWMFVIDGAGAVSLIEHGNRLDMVLSNDGQLEYLQFYPGNPPINVVAGLIEAGRERPYKKLHLYTLSTFTEAQRKTQREFPLLLHFVDRAGFESQVSDCQRRYTMTRRSRQPKRRTSTRAHPPSDFQVRAMRVLLIMALILLAGLLMILSNYYAN